MGLPLRASFCAPSWALNSPELTALSRGCFQHWGKEEFILNLIKHMAWCDIGGGGQGEPSVVLNETVDASLAPKSCWLCRGASPAVELLGGKGHFPAIPKLVTFISPALGRWLFAAPGAQTCPPYASQHEFGKLFLVVTS